MSNYQAGHDAEKSAAVYLETKGFRIHELNWKTRYCEIDIVAEKDKTIHFIEVKYRKNGNQGFGSDYITPKKIGQMRFAAEMWANAHDWSGEYQLGAISIDGSAITYFDLLDA